MLWLWSKQRGITQHHLVVSPRSAGYPSAHELEVGGLYEATSAKYSELPAQLLQQIAVAVHGDTPEDGYYRWFQRPVACNTAMCYQRKPDAFFQPHREYARSQLTRADDKKSASLSTIELVSTSFTDARPPDSVWRRIGVKRWPQAFWAWVEGKSLYVRKHFTGDEIRSLPKEAWEWYENHPQSRMFKPVDKVVVTLFTRGPATASVQRKFIELRMAHADVATFRIVDTDHDTFDGDRYCVDTLPCVYVEIEGTSAMSRATGRVSMKTLHTMVHEYL